MELVKSFENGNIKPNVPTALYLYKPLNWFPILSNWDNQIGLYSEPNNSIIVKFFLESPGNGRTNPNLVYSTDELFNKRVEYLISVGNKNNKRIEPNWYVTDYHKGLSYYKEIEEKIK